MSQQAQDAEPANAVTYELVAAAAEHLAARGTSPTLKRVREYLGSGSPHLIQRHLGAWRAAQPEPDPPSCQAPDHLIEAIEAEIARQVDAARISAERDAEEARNDATTLAEAGEALERRCAEQARELSLIHGERDAVVKRRDELETRCETLAGQLESEQKRGQESREQLAKLRQEVDMLTRQLEEQRQARVDAERQARTMESDVAQAERNQAVAEAQRESALEQAREKGEQLSQAQKELQAEKTRHRQEISDLRAGQKQRLDGIEHSRQEALKQAQEASQRATKAEIRAEALNATQAALKARMDAMQVKQRQRPQGTSNS